MKTRLLLLLMILPTLVCAQGFTVFREFFFKSQPPDSYFEGFGTRDKYVIYEDEITGGTPPFQESLVRASATWAVTKSPYDNMVTYDIEYLDTGYLRVGSAQAQSNALALAQMVGWARNQEPSLKFGMYSLVPITDLYAYSSPATMAEWQAGNDLLQPLADALDFITPSIYCYYNDPIWYTKYARAIVSEAKRVAKGKKVIPFVSPQYHPSGDHPDELVSKEYFATVLQTIKDAGADGVVLWAGSQAMSSLVLTWDPDAGWWEATKEFINSMGPTTAPVQESPANNSEGRYISTTLRWFAAGNANTYHLQLSTDPTFTGSFVVDDSTLTDTAKRVDDLSYDQEYFWRIRSANAYSSNEFSPTWSFRTAPDALPQNFVVLGEFFYLSQPGDSYFDDCGIKRSYVVHDWEIGSPPAEGTVRSTATQAAQNQGFDNMVQYISEAWEVNYARVGAAQAHANALLYAQMIGWVRSQEPSLKIGLYARAPITDIYAYGDPSTKAAWEAGNDLLQPLADSLNYLCPAIFCYYNDSTQYARYSKAIVQEAKRLAQGKKIFPFVSPHYHPAGDHPGQLVSKEYFASVLHAVRTAGADGVIIWAGSRAMDDTEFSWDGDAGWWQATNEFLGNTTSSVPSAPDQTATGLPAQLTLLPNYPNPFNPTTHISFSLPAQSHVLLEVYNVLGQRIATLLNSDQSTGLHIVSFDATGFSSGAYVVRLNADGVSVFRTIMLAK